MSLLMKSHHDVISPKTRGLRTFLVAIGPFLHHNMGDPVVTKLCALALDGNVEEFSRLFSSVDKGEVINGFNSTGTLLFLVNLTF